jgi:hypothetical protein
MGDDNKYAGDKSGGDSAATPDNKYAGDKSDPGSGATTDLGDADSGTATDSSGDSTSDPDSGISPANKYAG